MDSPHFKKHALFQDFNYDPEGLTFVFPGGGAKGIALIGVAKALIESQIPIRGLALCSMGSLVGTFAGLGLDFLLLLEDHLKNKMKGIDAVRKHLDWFLRDRTEKKSRHEMVGGDQIETLLRDAIGEHKNIGDSKVPLGFVATDHETGEEIWLNEDKMDIILAARASFSIPKFFKPVPIQAKGQIRKLVDGGVVNPVPINLALQMGGPVVAFDWDQIELDEKVSHNIIPPQDMRLIDVLSMVGGRSRQRIAAINRRFHTADLTILLNTEGSPVSFGQAESSIQKGYELTMNRRGEMWQLIHNQRTVLNTF